MTRTNDPPRWAEALLFRFLQIKDRETIAGDLLEEYRDGIVAGTGRFKADSKYIRQVFSILYTELLRGTTARRVLQGTCVLSIAAMTWFGFVSPAPATAPIAVLFVAQSLATIAIVAQGRRLPRMILQFGAIAVVLGGGLALYETLVWTAFEICVALTGVALIVQGVLTLALQFGFFGGFPSPRHSS
jgi:hypothetical protein